MDDIVSQWKILIVDDDLDNQMLAAEYMKYLGATVRTANDGVKGLEVLKDFEPTIILMDLSMPNMDGWTMFGEMQKDEALKRIPVIALTAHAMPQHEEQVKEAGFTGYVTKPFVFSRLLREIKHWLAEPEESDVTGQEGNPPTSGEAIKEAAADAVAPPPPTAQIEAPPVNPNPEAGTKNV
jgi:two-component system, cell cycle response regulator DivK